MCHRCALAASTAAAPAMSWSARFRYQFAAVVRSISADRPTGRRSFDASGCHVTRNTFGKCGSRYYRCCRYCLSADWRCCIAVTMRIASIVVIGGLDCALPKHEE